LNPAIVPIGQSYDIQEPRKMNTWIMTCRNIWNINYPKRMYCSN